MDRTDWTIIWLSAIGIGMIMVVGFVPDVTATQEERTFTWPSGLGTTNAWLWHEHPDPGTVVPVGHTFRSVVGGITDQGNQVSVTVIEARGCTFTAMNTTLGTSGFGESSIIFKMRDETCNYRVQVDIATNQVQTVFVGTVRSNTVQTSSTAEPGSPLKDDLRNAQFLFFSLIVLFALWHGFILTGIPATITLFTYLNDSFLDGVWSPTTGIVLVVLFYWTEWFATQGKEHFGHIFTNKK